MKTINLFLFALLPVLFLSISLHAERERSLNPDIVISNYETVVMEQGKGKVRPIFRVKNKGSRTYISIRLKFKKPEGLSPKGKIIKLQLNMSFKNSFTLKAGQEETVIPGIKGRSNLWAKTDQAITTYGTDCWFEFADVEGRLYRSPFYEEKEFARVIPYNKDILLSNYKPVVLEQGKSSVFPVFRVKNKGRRTYHDIFIKFGDPKIKGTYKRLTLGHKNSEKITLEPGQEKDFNSEEKKYPYVKTRPDQATGVYAGGYSIEYRDEENHTYKTPYVKIETFARVIPANPDIVVTDYKPLTVRQGESKITPVFRVKNKGKRPYRSIRLKYRKPVGILENGRKREIGIVGYCWAPIRLEPGQEVTYNPGCEGRHYLKTKPSQPPLTYSTEYWFEYYDSQDHLYRTPAKKIKDFIRVQAMQEDILLVDFKPMELEQGKNKVVPVFQAKNTGSRTYNSVRIICKNISGSTKKDRKARLAILSYASPRAVLKPGQVATLNPALKSSMYINAKPDQAITTYSADYYFEYYDGDGHKYTTPTHEIKHFARVIPFNSDIIVSHFETVEIQQGQKNVQPVFRIKNRGKQTYSKVTLKYKKPEGKTGKGKRVSLNLFNNRWRETTLKPGQEMVFNPAHRDRYIQINADEDQAAAVYSTHYWFEYRDGKGHKYKTPLREIKEFIRVVPIKRDILLTDYKTLVAEQGKSKLYPLFHIKNRGKRTYRNVSLQYDPPEIVTDFGRNKHYITIEGPGWAEWVAGPEWAHVTLKPGQEMILNASSEDDATLRIHPNQPIGTYSTKYWFEYRDDSGRRYKTPKYEIKEFVKVIPVKEYLVLTGFKTIELMQGQGKVAPVLRVKNTGSRRFEKVKLVFGYKTFGKDAQGKQDKLYINDSVTPLETLDPGQEKQINPAPNGRHSVYVSARTDQLLTTYPVKYHFQYIDSDGSSRKTPSHSIKDFVRVVPYNKDVILTGFKTRIAAKRGRHNGPLLVPSFRIKNTGSRIYTEIEVEYDLPRGFIKGTAGTRLKVNYDWDRRKGLKPGQEVEITPYPNADLFPVKLKNPSQKVFSTQYRITYYDAENHSYKTPKFTLEKFVVLTDEIK